MVFVVAFSLVVACVEVCYFVTLSTTLFAIEPKSKANVRLELRINVDTIIDFFIMIPIIC